MFSLGFGEIILILVVALLVFGPEKMPDVARTLGRVMAELRRTLDDMRHELNAPRLDLEEELRARPSGQLSGTLPAALTDEGPAGEESSVASTSPPDLSKRVDTPEEPPEASLTSGAETADPRDVRAEEPPRGDSGDRNDG